MPEYPRWVEIEITDADISRWPKNVKPEPDDEGNVNFMTHISVEHDTARRWRMVIGQALAEMLGYPDTGANLRQYGRNYTNTLSRKQELGSQTMARLLSFV